MPRRGRLVEFKNRGDPCGIRTRDLHLERVASWAARRTGRPVGVTTAPEKQALQRASGVYAIGFADHEADAAQGVRDAADLVVDDARGEARPDQLGLVD